MSSTFIKAILFSFMMIAILSSPFGCDCCDEEDCCKLRVIDDSDPELDDDDDDDIAPTGLEWVDISGGSYEMGCSENDDLCNPDETPSHTIVVSEFSITATEITQQQYNEVTSGKPSFFVPENGFDECPDCPVESLTWYEAKSYCELIGGRLPTEAEWEYAARGGSSSRFACGDDISCLDDVAWYSDNSGEKPHPVGQKEPNGFGLYDMLGNVWEWGYDFYASEYYQYSPLNDPPGAEDGWYRILRGGSWLYDPDAHMTVSDRFLQAPDHAYNYIGFRCVRE